MGRILFFVVLAALAYLGIVLARKNRVKEKRRAKHAASGEKGVVAMATCPQCGTHFPESEAVMGDGVAYCSESCRTDARKAK